jgi:Cu(I)/Ag(I) efflux system membrane fusion protein
MRPIPLAPALLAAVALAACQREPADLARSAPGAAPSAPPPAATAPAAPAPAVHEGSGTIAAVDRATATVTLASDPIPSLGWQARTVNVAVDGEAFPDRLEAGDAIRFALRQDAAGRLLLTDVEEIALAGAEHEPD